MGLRAFRDPAGELWQVWSVIPGLRRDEERRRGRDRRSDDPIFLYKGPERRASGDRRGRSAAALFPGLLAGWLTFECTTERRRLVPIPARWEEVPESELYELCQRATPVSCTLQRGEGLLDVGS
ncbi:hypothetical protein [Longimicrobium terrae]|uniref:Uncharacterized protein n=1 Tax=Longimicrobium terrae TaxID=1639882 RepID=A0A841H0Y8_9BACT|nr:hypothetical protein [Longimicrobium terrae]MBB4637343.1 hypothetical protein [Longimicrobium terrae]MBB6071741.1 hypothetical protein [Longimicrobium terrae]NNC28502.1 hypothetical protein [Longimicrobium terrae]